MATPKDRSAYMREWYAKNRESVLARQRAWYAANREQALETSRRNRKRDDRGYRDRREYQRQWWAKTKAANPDRHAHHITRSNRTRAIAGLPPEIHEMRQVLYEFRSSLLRAGRWDAEY